MSEIKILGCMDNTVDHTFESANRVYGVNGIAPTIPTCAGGGIQPKVMEIQKIVYDDYNSAIRADQRTMTMLTTNCGVTTLRNGVKIIEAAALRMVRTEEGKRFRKAYETHEVHHGYNEHRKAEPRTDGVCNTLTTVQKDNYIPEISKSAKEVPEIFHKFIYEIDGELYLIRIRKLTPLECWRLMGFYDSDYEKASSINSNTQLYKQAGNSIVKQVLMAVFSQMVKPQDSNLDKLGKELEELEVADRLEELQAENDALFRAAMDSRKESGLTDE